MKKLFFVILLIPFFGFAQNPAAEKGIRFKHGSLAELEALAKKENKMLMIDAFTTWCGPCKWMAKNIFPNDTVAEFYNANFISAEIDMEKGEGLEIAKKYEVTCYPTYLFLDSNGELKHRVSSSMPVKNFVDAGMSALNPAKQFAGYRKKYDAGTMTADEMADYILMRGHSCMSAKDEMTKYFSTQSESDLTNKRNWSLLWENRISVNPQSREFKYLVDHKPDFEKLYTVVEVERVIKDAYSFALYSAIKDKNDALYKTTREDVLKKNFSFSEEMTSRMDMDLYKSNKDWKNFAESAVKYVDKYSKENWNQLNSMAWDFYENISDKEMLLKAEEWIKHSVELQSGYANTDTYAAVLFKLGKKQEAQRMAEKAIELAKKDGEDYAETQALLDKVKAMK